MTVLRVMRFSGRSSQGAGLLVNFLCNCIHVNRIDRISAILIQLQSKPVVKAKEIAARFEISLRTVYRDIRSLEEAGVPIAGEAGVGYSLTEGYRLPPVMFTREEAQSFLAAERLVEQMTDTGMQEQYKSAMYKIRAVLRNSEKADISELEPLISRKPIGVLPVDTPSDFMRPVMNAISEKRVISMRYSSVSSRSVEDRFIEPVGLYLQGSKWHLVAFCRNRNDYRNFRLDRIENISLTPERFLHVHPTLEEWLSYRDEERQTMGRTEVVIRVDESIYHYFGDQKHYMGYLSEQKTEHGTEMYFACPSLEGFAHWFMMFGDKAEIIRPDELKVRVRELCSDVINSVNR